MALNGNSTGSDGAPILKWVYSSLAAIASFFLLWTAGEQRRLESRLELAETRLHSRVDVALLQQREDRAEMISKLDKLRDKMSELSRTLIALRADSKRRASGELDDMK